MITQSSLRQLPGMAFTIVLGKSQMGFADGAKIIDALDAVGLGLGFAQSGQDGGSHSETSHQYQEFGCGEGASARFNWREDHELGCEVTVSIGSLPTINFPKDYSRQA